jgi:hypothetical protein
LQNCVSNQFLPILLEFLFVLVGLKFFLIFEILSAGGLILVKRSLESLRGSRLTFSSSSVSSVLGSRQQVVLMAFVFGFLIEECIREGTLDMFVLLSDTDASSDGAIG